MLKQSIKEALILLLAALGIAVAVYAIRPDKIGPVAATANKDPARLFPTSVESREIDIEAARRLFKEKGTVFADARHEADFEAGHIQGAINLYAANPEAWLSDFLSSTDPATPIVTYCDGVDCPLARELAELLAANGFETVHYLKDGWTRWQERGLPVE